MHPTTPLPTAPAAIADAKPPTQLVYRHRLAIRAMHWINALSLFVLIGSGLQIFNAHPRLYWGQRSDPDRAWLSMEAHADKAGHLLGSVHIARWVVDTTGVFGESDVAGHAVARGFPSWLTIPGDGPMSDGGDGRLPMTLGRRWHFFFAWVFVINGLLYVGYGLLNGHLARNLWLKRSEWSGIARSLVDHLRLRHPQGEAVLRYNALQKLAYLLVIFACGAGIVLMGIAMSPRMDTVLAPMLDLVGGRQSARTIHFVFALGFVGFVIVHLAAIAMSGPFNQLRGMITGYYRIALPAPDMVEATHMQTDDTPTATDDEGARHAV